jgi:uncharacterized protein (DUF58 family)
MAYGAKAKLGKRKRAGLLRPEELVKIKDLFLVARGVVEGFVAGHHSSPYKGFSLEFAEHRKYVPGDELKHLDWKVYGRTQKYFVKLYEAETNMRVTLALDVSESMNFSGGSGPSKMLYCSYLAAALSFLISRQQDMVGLVTFNDRVRDYIPPRNDSAHLRNLIRRISAIECSGETRTAASLRQLAEKIRRRGLVVILSDLLDDPGALLREIRRFRHGKHEVIVFHVLDNAELMFPFKTTTTFLDMERRDRITVDPVALRREYLAGIEAFRQRMKTGLLKINVDYVPVNTLMPFEYVLSNYLNARRKTS